MLFYVLMKKLRKFMNSEDKKKMPMLRFYPWPLFSNLKKLSIL